MTRKKCRSIINLVVQNGESIDASRGKDHEYTRLAQYIISYCRVAQYLVPNTRCSMRCFTFLLFFCLLKSSFSSAQYTLRIFVTDPFTKFDIYAAGSFNNWEPKSPAYKMYGMGSGNGVITIKGLKPGTHRFKLTCGSWKTVEMADTAGTPAKEHVVVLRGDTTIYCTIAGWLQDYENPTEQQAIDRLRFALNKGFGCLYKNFDSSYFYALQTYTLAPAIKDLRWTSYALNLQGEIMMRLGNAPGALELYREALAIKAKHFDSASIGFLYNQVGNVCWQLHDTATAVKYFRSSYQLAPAYVHHHPLHEGMCAVICKLGQWKLAQHQLDSARYWLHISQGICDTISAITSALEGDLLRQENKPAEAAMLYRRGLQVALNYEQNLEIAIDVSIRLAGLFGSLDDKDSVMAYNRIAFIIAEKLQNPLLLSRIAVQYADAFKQQRRFDSALHYNEIALLAIEDMIRKGRERETLNTIYSQKMHSQQLVLQQERFNTRLIVLGLLAFVLVIIFLLWQYRVRQRKNFKRQIAEMEMQALRLQMNPHFIFNCMNTIDAYIQQEDPDKASAYLHTFSQLIRNVLEQSRFQFISVEKELETLKLYLQLEQQRYGNAFSYEFNVAPELLKTGANIPAMLIQPFIENAILHGLRPKPEGHGLLQISLEPTIDSKEIKCVVDDNGIGRKQARETVSFSAFQKTSVGLAVTSERMEWLRKGGWSNVRFSISDKQLPETGTTVLLYLPLINKAS